MGLGIDVSGGFRGTFAGSSLLHVLSYEGEGGRKVVMGCGECSPRVADRDGDKLHTSPKNLEGCDEGRSIYLSSM